MAHDSELDRVGLGNTTESPPKSSPKTSSASSTSSKRSAPTGMESSNKKKPRLMGRTLGLSTRGGSAKQDDDEGEEGSSEDDGSDDGSELSSSGSIYNAVDVKSSGGKPVQVRAAVKDHQTATSAEAGGAMSMKERVEKMISEEDDQFLVNRIREHEQTIEQLRKQISGGDSVTISQQKHRIYELEAGAKRLQERTQEEIAKIKDEAAEKRLAHRNELAEKWSVKKSEFEGILKGKVEAQAAKCEKKIETMKKQITDKEATHKAATAKLKESLEKKLDAADEKHEDQEEELKEKLKTAKEDHKQKMAKLREDQKTAIAARSPALRREIEDQRAKLKEAHTECVKLKQELADLKADLKPLQTTAQRYSEKCAELTLLRGELQQASEETHTLQTRLASLRTHAQEQHQAAETIRTHEGAIYRTLKQNASDTQATLTGTQRALANVKASVGLKDGAIAVLKAELATGRARAEKRVRELEGEVGRVQRKLRAMEDKGRGLQPVLIRKVGGEGAGKERVEGLVRELEEVRREGWEKDLRIAGLVARLEEGDRVAGEKEEEGEAAKGVAGEQEGDGDGGDAVGLGRDEDELVRARIEAARQDILGSNSDDEGSAIDVALPAEAFSRRDLGQ
ncbi:hypothetical protein MBLNU230_g6015t1 [Neophaeotheca triangularis]